MTQAYQDSANCKLELKFAQQSGVPIIPVMMQADFVAKGWLAILTAGAIWTPMYDNASVGNKLIGRRNCKVDRNKRHRLDSLSTASHGSNVAARIVCYGRDGTHFGCSAVHLVRPVANWILRDGRYREDHCEL